MADSIEAGGGKIHLGCPVQEIVIEDGSASGLRTRRATPIAISWPLCRSRSSPPDPRRKARLPEYLAQTEYLGIIAPLLVLDRPLTSYWTLNITDDRIPFTGVIETTAYIDPQYVGGHHLIYLPKYTSPTSHWQKMSDDEIRETWLENLEKMFPDFDRGWVRHFLIHRERYVEPLHGLNETHLIPAIKTPIDGLYLATTAQIYPALTNGESVVRYAQHAAQTFLLDHAPSRVPGQAEPLRA